MVIQIFAEPDIRFGNRHHHVDILLDSWHSFHGIAGIDIFHIYCSVISYCVRFSQDYCVTYCPRRDFEVPSEIDRICVTGTHEMTVFWFQGTCYT